MQRFTRTVCPYVYWNQFHPPVLNYVGLSRVLRICVDRGMTEPAISHTQLETQHP